MCNVQSFRKMSVRTFGLWAILLLTKLDRSTVNLKQVPLLGLVHSVDTAE